MTEAEAKPLKAIVCDVDPINRQIVSRMVVEAGFEVMSEAGNAVETIQQNQYLHPTLVVISHDQHGLSGLAAIAEIRSVENPPEVILVAHDAAARAPAVEMGAFELAVKGDIDLLGRLLSEVRELLETGERRKSSDRRTERDGARSRTGARSPPNAVRDPIGATRCVARRMSPPPRATSSPSEELPGREPEDQSAQAAAEPEHQRQHDGRYQRGNGHDAYNPRRGRRGRRRG